MSAVAEIDAAVAVLRQANCHCVLMQCTSLYPTPLDQVHLRSLTMLANRYQSLVGFSDHAPGILLPPVAVGMGAVAVEKHLTLDRHFKGTDHACSLEPAELQQMVVNIRQVEAALGRADKPVAVGVEQVKAKLGRSLVTRVPLIAGMQLQEPMLALKCPGDGLSWGERGQVVGRRLKRDVPADEKISVEDFV
jgi:sialic acid synthase SpsE